MKKRCLRISNRYESHITCNIMRRQWEKKKGHSQHHDYDLKINTQRRQWHSPTFEPLRNEPHGSSTHILGKEALKGAKFALAHDVVEGCQGLGGCAVDVGRDEVNQPVICPLAPFYLLSVGHSTGVQTNHNEVSLNIQPTGGCQFTGRRSCKWSMVNGLHLYTLFYHSKHFTH